MVCGLIYGVGGLHHNPRRPVRDGPCELQCHEPVVKHELPGLAHDAVKVVGPGQGGAGGQYDPGRMMFFFSYISEMKKANGEDGADVMGFFAQRSRAAPRTWRAPHSRKASAFTSPLGV